ncbi:hypothetical protein FA13DRAFT_332830 [Coprinellus micaceus]|uniref:Uncharacterized protein n=1 Tax=Coprinellus micaceus TaxID=71717 RepID=A0A4Y7TBJ7_COPMI|nr:hypothetical protein FA13DRAFT_332830 [Coprinellus micaceus]
MHCLSLARPLCSCCTTLLVVSGITLIPTCTYAYLFCTHTIAVRVSISCCIVSYLICFPALTPLWCTQNHSSLFTIACPIYFIG